MFIEISPYSPDDRIIEQVVRTLEKGGVIIYPTDTVYGIGCDINKPKAIEKICKIRGLDPSKANLTFICKDISQISEYTLPIENSKFKLMKKNTPGPFTFILPVKPKLSKFFKNKKKTIGVRIIDNEIVSSILLRLRRPLLSLSLKSDDEMDQYITEPFEMYEHFKNDVDFVIDGGTGTKTPSSIIDLTGDEPEILRQSASKILF